MGEPRIAFITYTKGAMMYVTSPEWESHFLDWLNSVDSSKGYERETHSKVGVVCAPRTVHATEKREATILKLVDKGVEDKSA
jgi:hypothetical protein